MAGFDVAVGIYQNTLNTTLLPQIYNVVHSDLLKKSIDVNKFGISSVEFDIQAPPTVNLEPSAEAIAHIAATIETLHKANEATGAKPLTSSDKSTILRMASSATFSVKIPKVALTVNYTSGSSPTKVPASLDVHATISVDGSDSDLTVKISSAKVNIPNNDVLQELLNNAFIPFLIESEYLDGNILSSIKIPSLGYGSLRLSAPLPVIQNSYLEAFSALGSTPPTIPDSFPWPSQDGLCIAADIATLETAAGLKFPMGPKESFSWNIFSGDVGAQVKVPKVSKINDDGSISASIEVEADCQLTLHAKWPHHNVSFGPTASATLSVTLRPSVENGELEVAPESIPNISFSFDWGTPGWIDHIFKPLELALAAALHGVLGRLIKDAINIPIPILHVPDISFTFSGDKKITITIDEAIPSGYQGKILVIAAQLNVSK